MKRSIFKYSKIREIFENKNNILLILTISSVILGFIVGLILKFTIFLNDRQIYLISFPGDMLMSMLKMVLLPLLTSSLITALSGMDVKSSGKMGFYTIMYYSITTTVCLILGMILVTSIHPGNPTIKESRFMTKENIAMTPGALDAFLDLLRNIFPSNLIEACFRQMSTSYINEKGLINQNVTRIRENYTKIIIFHQESTNILGLVAFSIAFGLIVSQMGDRGKIMFKFFSVLNEVILRLVAIIMWYFPFGMFFLIIGKILEIKNVTTAASSLGLYIITVLLGLSIHSIFTLPLFYFIVTRKNPFRFFTILLPTWITAFGTASSTATLPITFRCLDKHNLVDKRVSRFVLPIGATINMDGTALYEAVASIFIAQINGLTLSFGQIISMSVTATFAAIGASCVPSSGLVTMIPPLMSVGLPVSDITLILTVDWFLDRVRTTVNVLGDSLGSGIVEHLYTRNIKQIQCYDTNVETYN